MKFTLIKDLLPMFKEKLEKFVKKYKIDYVYEESDSYICEDKESPRFGLYLVDINVEAEYKLGDYSFVASFEWVDEAKENLIKKASEDIYVPAEYKTRRACDHCGTNRYRKSTVLLKSNETGEYVQVGKSCLKDYTGVNMISYASFLSFYDTLDSYIEDCEKKGFNYAQRMYEVDDILEQTIERVKRNGYIAKQKSWELDCDSTASVVFKIISGYIEYYSGKLAYERYTVSDETKAEVLAIKEFFRNYEESSDYVNNLKTLMNTTWVDGNNLGLVVSAVGMRARLESQKVEKETKIPSEHVGNIGERITFRAKPIVLYTGENTYGFFAIYKMMVNNNVIVWKTSTGLNSEKEYDFTATIKSHDEYRNEKQTSVTRCRVKEVV